MMRPATSSTDASVYVSSQAHLLKPTQDNPLPTAVPPPIAATAGTLGVRHVLCLIGLPERGKPFIAGRLEAYLSFFHGAEVRRFNINDYSKGTAGSDENADALLTDLRAFMGSMSKVAGRNMDQAKACQEDSELIDANDTRRKNVDSGKVAIIFCTDSVVTFKERWSGTSKERRRYVADTLRQDKALGAKLIFIEVIVNKPEIIEANIRAKRRALDQGEATATDMRDHYKRVQQYQRMYVTLQDDGSEDDLSYIKLYNYGGKVVTNRMHGYLRMRIAQFLTTIHTTPHVIYLSRHGQSEYNVLGKIGGNPPLSPPGAEYAERLGAWVPQNVWRDPHGRLIKCRLWTSSLQRTILTAAHVPHPLLHIGEDLHEAIASGAYCADPNAQSPALSAAAPAASLPVDTSPLPASHASVAARALLEPPLTPQSSPSAFGMPASPFAVPRLTEPGLKTPPMEEGTYDLANEMWEQMSPRVYRNLDEIFAGEYEGMTYEDIKRLQPDEAALRSMDKIGYRYPRGESYFDILARLDPLVHEMESYHEPLLIVSHQAVLRVLYAYLMGLSRTSAPKLEIPLHAVMKITYDGWNPPFEERTYLGPDPLPITTGEEAGSADGQRHL